MSDGDTTEKVLPSGEVVRVEPPSDDFPDGRQVLISAPDVVADRLPEIATGASEAYAELKAKQRARLVRTRHQQAAVPPEKRFL